jgi:peptidoglycan/xylan/chitin deacetylase (PgdA/CDA1 family)
MLYGDLARKLFHQYGGMATVRWLHRQGATVLMYHKFPADQSILEKQCEYLRKYYRVITMSYLHQLLRTGDPIPDRSVVITVDDGHSSFYYHGYPVFSKFNYPVLVYLTTDPIDTRGWLWFDRVAYAFLNSPLSKIDLLEQESFSPSSLLPPMPLSLGNKQQRLAIANQLMEFFKTLPSKDLPVRLIALERALRVQVPEEAPPEWAALTWEQIRLMSESCIDFGGHTITHPILANLADQAALYQEIAGPRSRIESELGKPALHFAYPNGQPQDISRSVTEAVCKAGYQTAATTIGGQVFSNDDSFLLKRIPSDCELSPYAFRQHVAAFRT